MPEIPKILIVDDNELNIKLCCAIFKDRYRIFTGRTAQEGIESAKRIFPDLILMDIQLPGMDGLAATRVIKSDDALKTTPVIALTSFAMVGDREKALSSGCDEYFPKPIDIQALKAMVARFLEGRSAIGGGSEIEQRPAKKMADPVLS